MDTSINGVVIRGESCGRTLGFPTANLDADAKGIKSGVYSGKAIINDKTRKTYRAAIIIKNDKAEAYLLGFRGDLYGKVLTLKIRKFIREYKKFDSERELKAQIGKDLKKC